MTTQEKRKFIRHDALHLLDYLVLDEEGNPGNYSMGRTIDVSTEGLKLETVFPLEVNSHLRITLGIEKDLVELEGKIIHAGPQDGRFFSGIIFEKITEDGKRILAKYIEAFNKQQNKQ
jgi:hypothetical protein